MFTKNENTTNLFNSMEETKEDTKYNLRENSKEFTYIDTKDLVNVMKGLDHTKFSSKNNLTESLKLEELKLSFNKLSNKH